MDKIKIAHIIYGLRYGGAEKLLIPLSTKLNPENFEVIVIALYLRGPLFKILSKESVKVYVLREDGRFGIFDFLRLIKILKEEKINIIHTHLLLADVIGGLAARLCKGTIHISTLHGIYLKKGDLIYNLKQWIRVRIPSYIIAVSKSVIDTCRRLGISEDKISLIYNGTEIVDPSLKTHLELKEHLKIDKNIKVILSIGALEEIKGYFYLLELAERLLRERKDVFFLIIGDGSLRQKLQKSVEDRNLSNYIRFLGNRDDVHRFLSICDIFLNTSLSEGCPLSILEAMAFKRCVVATNVGGNPEIIDNGLNGILISLNDSFNTVEVLKKLLDNEPWRKQLGENAFRKVKECFVQEIMLKRIEDFYMEKITRKKSLNIAIIDAYSPKNIGSYSLLENSLKILKECFKNSNIRIFSYEPLSIQRLTGIRSFPEPFILPFGDSFSRKIWWLLDNLLWILLYIIDEAFHFHFIYYISPKNKRIFLKSIKEADLIFSIGAERINDNLYKGTVFYLFQYWLIKKMGKKTIFLPQTIGPLYFWFSRFLVKRCLTDQKLIMVRDEFSRNNLLNLGIKRNVEFVPDVGLLQQGLPYEEALRILSKEVSEEISKSNFLGVSVLRWSYFKMKGGNFLKYKIHLKIFFDWIIENLGINIICFSTNLSCFKGTKNDVEVGLEIKELLRNKERFFVLKKLYNPKELKGMISLSEAFVSTRMHATIFSTSSFIPTISINYQPKCREYMRSLGLEELSIDIDRLDANILKQKFSYLWIHKDEIKETLRIRIPQIQERILAIPDIIKKYLNDK